MKNLNLYKSIWITLALLLIYGNIVIYSSSCFDKSVLLFCGVALLIFVGMLFLIQRCAEDSYKFISNHAALFYLLGIVMMALLLTPLRVSRNGITKWVGINGYELIRPDKYLIIASVVFMSFCAKTEKSRSTESRDFLDVLMEFSSLRERHIFDGNLFGEMISIIIKKCKVKLWIPLCSVVLIMIFRGHIETYGLMILLAIVIIIITEEKLSQKIFLTVGYITVAIICMFYEDYDFLDYQMYHNEFIRSLQKIRWMAVERGGICGVGYGKSHYKLEAYFPPLVYGDDAIIILAEEKGIIAIMIMAVLFILLLVEIGFVFRKAKYNGDIFGMSLSCAIGVQFFYQISLACIGTVLYYISGVLPFFTYGEGSFSYLLSIMEIGMVILIAKQDKQEVAVRSSSIVDIKQYRRVKDVETF